MAHKILMPKAGQSMEEGTIVSWLKKEGDTINRGDAIMVIQTDKADLEVESQASGTLVKILVEEGESSAILKTVGIIAEEGEEINIDALLADEAIDGTGAEPKISEPAEKTPAEKGPSEKTESGKPTASSPRATPTAKNIAKTAGIHLADVKGSGVSGRIMKADVLSAENPGRIFASPYARKLASEKGFNLSLIKGTGPQGRIIERDINSYIPQASTEAVAGQAIRQADQMFIDGKPETVELTGMRKAIAGALQQSKQQAPHFYATMEINMTNAMAYKDYLKKTGRKVTVNDLVLMATVKSLRQLPKANCRIEGNSVTYYPSVNLGVAVGLEEGLVVPVILKADNMSLEELSKETRRIVSLARNGKLIGMGQGTFTVTNMGMFGIESFSAIINPPEGAILAVGAVKDSILVKGQTFSTGQVMKVTISVDHRVIDGMLAARFLNSLKVLLEKPESLNNNN